MKCRRLLSALLVAVMILTSIPLSAISAMAIVSSETEISINNSYAASGAEVNVDVVIENNPGILGMTLKLNYDEEFATLTSVVSGEALNAMTFTAPRNLQSGCTLQWDAEFVDEKDVKDGVIATLTFRIDESAPSNEKIAISLSYDNGAIIDNDLNPVNVSLIDGTIQILDYTPGDLNDDGIINSTDVVFLRRYIAGYDITIKEAAGDVNDDGLMNSTDVVFIRRYIAGYDIELKPVTPKCKHSMTATSAVDATCTKDGNIAYWYCSECEKYFSDPDGKTEIAKNDTIVLAGHTLTYVDAKAASYTQEGNIEHWKCDDCNKYFGNSIATIKLEESEVIIPKLVREESTIVYNIYTSDPYLESVGVDNSLNPSKFYSNEGVILNDIIAPEGYIFKGWTNASGEPVTEIAPHSTSRQIVLNAVWDKQQYTISFYSPIAPRASIKRTIDEAVPVDNLNELTKYKFMGWTDIYGNLVTMVKPGTMDITLYANWISYRNQTISHDYLNKGPITIEDEEKGQYLFVYDIGKIINVPLYTIKDFGNTTSGIIRVESDTVTNSISNTTAKEITETIAKSTTNSATWTLSKDWNELITNTEDFTESQLKENSVVISDGWAHTSGSETNKGTVTDTGTLTKDNTNTKDLTTHNAGGSVEVDVEIAKKGLASKLSPVGVDIKAEGHYDYTHQGGSETDHGTDEYNLTHTNNLTSSSSSTTNSHDKTTSEKIAEEVSKQWGYSISKSTGGGSSASENSSNTQSNESMYSTTFSYTVAQEKTTVKEYSTASAEPGWHRLVCAGTVHVFAVVGYDIATHTYFYYTYSVLDDTTSEFYDYSATNGEYNDYEVGVLPFEVPVSIHEYVTDKVYLTNGLIIDDKTGVVVEYEGDYTHVNIPDYYSRDNGDGTYDVVKIVGVESSVFANNTKIKSVRLSNFITEIPDNAFSGCTNLEVIDYDKLVSIGANAFKNCISLEKITIETDVVNLGADAFVNVPEVILNACNYNVASNGTRCGAKNIVLNLKMEAQTLENCSVCTEDTSETLTINGYKNVYKNFEIVSNCASVNINGVTFDSNLGIPMTFSADNVVLTNVSVINASSLALLLKSDSTNLVVDGTNTIHTLGDAAILCKGININKLNGSSVKCVLQVTNGKIYICGSELTDTDKKYLDVSESQIEYIDSEQYVNMLNSHFIRFDANGGTVSTDSKLVMWNSKYGELPTPTRDYYTFSGWFTAAEGGEQVTADTVMTEIKDVVVYAHWTLNEVSGWVKASDMPSGAQAVNTKWSYVLREYTTNAASSLSGWTKYDTQRTSWGATQGPVYSDPSNGVRNVWSEQYVASQTTHYTYYHRYGWGYNVSTGQNGYVWSSDSQNPNAERHTIDLTYALTKTSNFAGNECWKGYTCPHCGAKNIWLGQSTYKTDNYATRWYYQEPVYTYYYYRDLSKEATSDPTSQSNVSNVVRWVQYRAK